MFKKSTPNLKERANAALASLQRNAYAMNILRSRLESRINFTLNQSGKNETYQELTRVLELVKNGEMILNEMSGKIESAKFLEEFIMIIDSAAASMGEIKNDVEELVPAAEAALQEMHDAIAKVSSGMYSQEASGAAPEIMAEASDAIAAKAAPMMAPKPAIESEEEQPEPVPA